MGEVRIKAHGAATMTDDWMAVVHRHAEAVAVISDRSIGELHRRDHLLIRVGRHDTTAAQRVIPEQEIRRGRTQAPDGKRPAHVEQPRVAELPVVRRVAMCALSDYLAMRALASAPHAERQNMFTRR